MKLPLSLSLIFFSILLVCTGCCHRPCDYAVMGPDEFVIDSYTIRQGKFAILEMEGICVEELDPSAMREYKDVVAEDDILNIVLYHPKRKDLMEAILFINKNVGGFRVTNGVVDLPDIPPVHVAGLTLDEAREALQEKYREQVQDVELFVTYQDRLTRKVELAGLVAHTNVPVDGKKRLYDVLANAHIPSDANLFLSYVVRDGCPLAVDLYKLMNEGDMNQNIVMRGGDKVFIANKLDSSVMVMGEVNNPRPVHLPYGFMSLREVLVHAGGIPFTGDKRHIQVIRGNLQCPKIYTLSWDHIIHLPNDSLLLIPGDTVYVSAKAITEWNRFIGQLVPSAGAFQQGHSIYQTTATD
ncbi:MAG: polysaccharide biosynthesis/export family protein [Parachlamydiaceae bacterium]